MIQVKRGALSYYLLEACLIELGEFLSSFLNLLEEGSVADQGYLYRLDVSRPFLVLGQSPQEIEVVDHSVGNAKGSYPILLAEEIDSVFDSDSTIPLTQRGRGEADQANATMGCGCGETDQVQGGASAYNDDVRVTAHRMLVQISPNPFDERPVVFGSFSTPDEGGFGHEIQPFLAPAEVAFDPLGQIGVSVQNAFVDIDKGFGPPAFAVRLEDFSKRIIGRGKGILREENTMGAIQANVFTDGGVGGRHGMEI